jgi:hypothetical protein
MKLLGLVDKAADADQRWEEAEGQCEDRAEELSLLRIRGSVLCLTMVGTPQWSPLHEGMQFAVSCHPEVAMRLATIWAEVASVF